MFFKEVCGLDLVPPFEDADKSALRVFIGKFDHTHNSLTKSKLKLKDLDNTS